MRRKPYREKLAEVTSEIRERNEPLTREIFEILIRKNKDYTESDGNQFQGFIDAAELSGIDGPERVMFSRMVDKFKRISNLLKSGEPPAVVDEKIQESLKDLAGYSIILIAFLDWVNSEEFEFDEKPNGD